MINHCICDDYEFHLVPNVQTVMYGKVDCRIFKTEQQWISICYVMHKKLV